MRCASSRAEPARAEPTTSTDKPLRRLARLATKTQEVQDSVSSVVQNAKPKVKGPGKPKAAGDGDGDSAVAGDGEPVPDRASQVSIARLQICLSMMHT
jgi:hypothetical protein